MIKDKKQAINIVQTFLNKASKDGVFENLNDSYTCIMAWNLICSELEKMDESKVIKDEINESTTT